MQIGLQNPERLQDGSDLGNAVLTELGSLIATLRNWGDAQHKDDGSHSAITADSIVVAGGIVSASMASTGDIIARDGTGSEVGIGTLPTVNGAQLLPGELLRSGVLIGGVSNGFFLEQRVGASPMDGNTFELAVWNLKKDVLHPVARLGIIGGSPTLIDGGSGSAGLYLGDLTRYLSGVFGAAFYRPEYSAAQGEWTQVPYSAGNFTGNGSLVWTVGSGTVDNFSYEVHGKTLTVAFSLLGTTVSGAGTNLQIALPNGYISAHRKWNAVRVQDNGVDKTAVARVDAGGTLIRLLLDGTSGVTNWTASAGNTSVFGQVSVEIQ